LLLFINFIPFPILGSSVFGIKYKDGVLLAADTLGSYGSMARFPNIERVIRVNESTVIACTGDYADFQFLRGVIEQKQIDEEISGGGETMKPEALHRWLTSYLYNKRSKFDPLWTTIIVGGIQEGKPFLACVNYIGAAWKERAIATGLGQDIAVPIMRRVWENGNNIEQVIQKT
jgi:20S proteasome subunit beta 7